MHHPAGALSVVNHSPLMSRTSCPHLFSVVGYTLEWILCCTGVICCTTRRREGILQHGEQSRYRCRPYRSHSRATGVGIVHGTTGSNTWEQAALQRQGNTAQDETMQATQHNTTQHCTRGATKHVTGTDNTTHCQRYSRANRGRAEGQMCDRRTATRKQHNAEQPGTPWCDTAPSGTIEQKTRHSQAKQRGGAPQRESTTERYGSTPEKTARQISTRDSKTQKKRHTKTQYPKR